MRLVILESPYAAATEDRREAHVRYARDAMLDCLRREEAPLASHLLYTQPGILDDADPAQRALGIEAGLAWGRKADATVVYVGFDVSPGMRAGILRAHQEGRPVEFRLVGCAGTAKEREVQAFFEREFPSPARR
jgi:hypothetical protein